MFKIFQNTHTLKAPLEKIAKIAEKNLPQDKLDFLYTYARKSLDDEIARFQVIDDKSIKLLSSVSIMITIFLALVKWIFEGSVQQYTLYVYVLVTLVFVSLSFAWFYFFSALKLRSTPRMPFDDAIFELIKNKRMDTVHVALCKCCKIAVDESKIDIEEKANKLDSGYKATSFAALFLLLTITIVSFESIKPSIVEDNLTKEENKIMANGNEPEETQESDNGPDWDVTAPEVTYVRNSEEKPDYELGHIVIDTDD
ncbi:hypothetical protein AB4406_23105 [Vibrio splendidus]|uniref:hypothetical protein n=1 Tax=Vibrio cyclitrophicus TaxID=47951 RepID=UPI001054BF08|nr:hypothetical protein [Vibrio cyclitrophicus]